MLRLVCLFIALTLMMTMYLWLFLCVIMMIMSTLLLLLFVDDKGGENCANIIYAENYRYRHKLRGRSYTRENSELCCHQSKMGRMLSQDFHRVLISDKGINRDRQKEGSSLV